VLLDEGNRGGMGGASLRLHPNTRGQRSATRSVAARLVPFRKMVPRWVVAGPRGLDPKPDWAGLMQGENMEKLEQIGWAGMSRWAIIED
jgi:hypothetical protein